MEAHTGRKGHNKHPLFIPQIDSSFGENGVYFHGAAIWNSLQYPLRVH